MTLCWWLKPIFGVLAIVMMAGSVVMIIESRYGKERVCHAVFYPLMSIFLVAHIGAGAVAVYMDCSSDKKPPGCCSHTLPIFVTPFLKALTTCFAAVLLLDYGSENYIDTMAIVAACLLTVASLLMSFVLPPWLNITATLPFCEVSLHMIFHVAYEKGSWWRYFVGVCYCLSIVYLKTFGSLLFKFAKRRNRKDAALTSFSERALEGNEEQDLGMLLSMYFKQRAVQK